MFDNFPDIRNTSLNGICEEATDMFVWNNIYSNVFCRFPMARKGRGKTNTSVPEFDAEKFLSAECESRRGLLARRNIIHERVLSIPEDDMPQVPNQIEKRGWEYLVTYPENKEAYAELVVEFYCNAYCPQKDKQKEKSFVRGKQIPFDADTINSLLKSKLLRTKDQWPTFKQNVNTVSLLRELCKDETEWILDSTGKPKKFPSSSLVPLPKIWAAYIGTNLVPCSNVSDIKVEKAALISAIMTGKVIDVGKIIQTQIQIIANSATNALAFPRLITLLCEKAKVDMKSLPPLRKHAVIDWTYVCKYCGVDGDDDVDEPKRKRVRRQAGAESSHQSAQTTSRSREERIDVLEGNVQALRKAGQIQYEDIMKALGVVGQSLKVTVPEARTSEDLDQLVGWVPMLVQPSDEIQTEESGDESE